MSYSNDSLQKHWIVANLDDPNPGRHTFFVTGHGYVYKNGTLQRSDARFQHDEQQIEDASNVLDQITGIWYVPTEEGIYHYANNPEQDAPGGNHHDEW